jgi:hypothetical protein
MEKVLKIEMTLKQDLADLYSQLMDEFEAKSSIPLSEMNRTILQTGLIQHLLMMQGVGLIDEQKRGKINALIDQLSKETVMWEVIQLTRQYWRRSGGQSGTLDIKA